MDFEPIEDLEIAFLFETLADCSYFDPDEPSKVYAYPNLKSISRDELIQYFIEERLEGNFYEDLSSISAANSSTLIRQMAMFARDQNNRKQQNCDRVEAKDIARQVLEFMGNKTEFHSNVGSVNQPHDQPGRVVLNDHLYGFYDSICLIAINEEHLLFLEQSWNFQGE